MLTFSNVSFAYNGVPVLEDVSFSIEQGEFCFLIGKSGAGKSTLLQMIYMNLLPQSGSVEFAQFNSASIKSKELPYLRRKIGVIFQDFRLLKERTIGDNLAFVLEVINTPSKEIRKRVNNALSDVGLSHRRSSYPDELSGGERQRVAIARAIINEPYLVLADEPTGNLDPETTTGIVEILNNINRRGTAVLFATHNYDIVKKQNSRILKIENGKVLKAVIKQKQPPL